MRPVNQKGSAILDILVDGLEHPSTGNSHRKIDNTDGAFMPVVVECIGTNLYSVAHYYEQNGDLMADPEMTFWRDPVGRWFAASFTQHNMGIYQEAIEFGDEGTPEKFWPRLQADQSDFAGTWMVNIKSQQGLDSQPPPTCRGL